MATPAASTVAPERGAPRRHVRTARSPWPALARRAFADGRIRTIAFAYLFLAVSYIQPVAYRHAYPTLQSRIAFAASFAANKAVRLFYGEPRNLLTDSGYAAWRAGGILVIFAGLWGVLAAVRALRADEEAGRTELVLAAAVSRRALFSAALSAIAAGCLLLWIAQLAGLLLAGLPAGGSAYLALAVVSAAPVFAGIGALASQLAPTRRLAIELSSAALAVGFVLRVVADTSGGLGWLRWLTPLGWEEELRPFSGGRPLVLLVPLAASALLLCLSMRIASRRDVGAGLLAARDEAPPRTALLTSPIAQALRGEVASLAVWLFGVGAFAFIVGVIANSISSAGISRNIQQELARLGSGSILTPSGYIGFAFIFFVLTSSLFAVSQIGAARGEEAAQRLETMLALPVGRLHWLGGRLALAAAGTVVVSLVAGVLTWAGAVAAGVSISFARMLEAGANCIPAALLFLGIAVLCYALMPRAGTGVAYGLLSVAFLWDLFGSILGAPKWVVDLSPFEHVALVPAQSFRVGAAAVMIGIALLATVCAGAVFSRRDVLGA